MSWWLAKRFIAIAHRLSTIAQMDRLIVLDQGRIAEVAHEQLITHDGLGVQLWKRQTGWFHGRSASDSGRRIMLI